MDAAYIALPFTAWAFGALVGFLAASIRRERQLARLRRSFDILIDQSIQDRRERDAERKMAARHKVALRVVGQRK